MRKRSFTLVELLTVVAIIAVLVGIVLGLMGHATRKASDAKTQSLIKQLSAALESYKAKYGYYPQRTTVGPFYLDQVHSSDASGQIKNNFNQFLTDYELFKNKETANDAGSPAAYWVLDGYGQVLLYRSPGWFNRGGFDLGSVGANSYFGAQTSTTYAIKNLYPAVASEATYKSDFGKGDDIANFSR